MSNPLRVLVVEDSEDDTLLLQRTLQRGGFDLTVERVDTAADMSAALNEQSWDVIISDYNLPQFSGLAALELVQERQVDLPFIIVSGAIGEEVAVEAMKSGAHDYVMKDNLARLIPVIERELREAEVRRERKRAEEALRQSEERLRVIFDNVPVPIFTKDRAGRYTSSNVYNLSYWSHDPVGNTDADLLPPEFAAKVRAADIQVMETGQELVIEEQFPSPHGMRSPIVRKVPLRDAEGNIVGILGIAHDITERKQAEEEIRRRNRELAMLNSIIAASVTSLEPEEILETACRELAKAFDVPRATAAMLDRQKTTATKVAEYLVEGQPIGLEHSWPVSTDPSLQHIMTHKAPLIIDDTSTDPRLVSIQDMLRERGITSMVMLPLIVQDEVIGSLRLGDLKSRSFSNEEIGLAWSVADQVAGALARTRLDKERRQLSAAIEQTAESVIITDTRSTILYVNPAFARVSGYNRAEVVGFRPSILNSGKQDTVFYQDLWTTISAGQVWQGRFINKKKDGTLYTDEATITPVRSETGDIVNYVSVQRDITNELKLEEQYRQTQKMEAVGRLAAGIAHDFNNLLTAINGFATLIQNELSSTDPLQELVEKILHSGERAADLVRQLLAFSRRQVVKPQVLNLNTVVTNMDKMLPRIIGEHIELATVLTPDLWSIKADPSQIEQIIVNLAVNASDAMPDGGQLTIETANVIIDQDYAAEHLDAQPGEHVLLCVSDTGTGMTEEVKGHIFEPFFTTKEVGKGTGLGLATVFGIIKQSNGHIWVYSEPGHGSVFRVYLPRVTQAVPSSFVSNLTPMLPQGMETVLLVEDEAMVRELAARVLRQQGYTVLEVANGPEALRLVRGYDHKIDLLLTDVIMPQMNGQMLAEELKILRPETKVLFTSGYTHNSIMRRGVLKPGVRFIQKPFSPLDLTRKVREILDDRQ